LVALLQVTQSVVVHHTATNVTMENMRGNDGGDGLEPDRCFDHDNLQANVGHLVTFLPSCQNAGVRLPKPSSTWRTSLHILLQFDLSHASQVHKHIQVSSFRRDLA